MSARGRACSRCVQTATRTRGRHPRRSCPAVSSSASRSREHWCSSRRILLLDEPLSNLDAQLRIYMRTELTASSGGVGITTVFVTHDQEEAMSIVRPHRRHERRRARADGRAGGDLRPSGLPRGRRFFRLAEPSRSQGPRNCAGAGRHLSREPRVRGEGWEGTCATRTAEAFAADTTVLVMIRPEDARIGAPD